MSQWRSAATGALVALGLGPGMVGATEFDRVVVFGDSLSDSGNAGRFSNGPVWVEQLGDRLGLDVVPRERGGSNFAIGGARLDPGSGPSNLQAQVERYLQGRPAIGRVLYIVFGGGNDLLAAVQDPRAEQMVEAAAASLRDIVADLAEAGAGDIIVPNLPDVGMTPAIASRGRPAREHARRLTDRLNAKIDRALAEITSSIGLQVHRLDVYEMAERARNDPAAFGFVDVVTPCIALRSCDGYLFWDQVHPTTHGHARLADAALTMLLSPGAGEELGRARQ